MLFNSVEFLVFFPIVVGLYFASRAQHRWALLLAASYVFYMAWKPAYIILILISTLIDYIAGIKMGDEPRRRVRRVYLLASLVSNLSLLFLFKYYGFFSMSLSSVLRTVGVDFEPPMLDVALPVGISFYTFQTLSYTIEVYKGNQEPERHLGMFALYVAYFPQLVAGPIERSTRLLPQLHQTHEYDYDRVRQGLMFMLWGMFKKVVVADRLALVVNGVYGDPASCPGWLLAVGTIFFAFQIYCDFSGYSDIAIGAARVMGVDLMRNFNRPYEARSVGEFWQRWHISLSTWFRDYVYIPLGGNRATKTRWAFNIMVTFAVSGLWHGAKWTFVIWGALHGAWYLVSHVTTRQRAVLTEKIGLTRVPRLHACVQMAITFSLVCVTWVFFRANSTQDALYVLAHLPDGWLGSAAYETGREYLRLTGIGMRTVALDGALIAFVCVLERLQNEKTFAEYLSSKPVYVRWGAYIALAFAMMNMGVVDELPFVYFQF